MSECYKCRAGGLKNHKPDNHENEGSHQLSGALLELIVEFASSFRCVRTDLRFQYPDLELTPHSVDPDCCADVTQ